jgi:hypothetical protein
MKIMRTIIALILAVLAIIFLAKPALAFCGFYVAKADTKLYNEASQVIIARDGQRTVLTMANDYQGEVKDFALVVPVPVVLLEEQVHVGDPKIIERLDAFSAPRLVEYFDENPCDLRPRMEDRDGLFNAVPSASSGMNRSEEKALGVTIESQFTVGEYDILILSAKESNGLETWLRQNGYNIPKGASQILQPYIQENLKFFVAKVNLKEYQNTGFKSLRPLMMAFESPKFMLPIRLGMINSKGEQDLIVYLLSPKGQIELANYRTVQIPSNLNIPEFVQNEFGDFYKSLLVKSYQREDYKVALLEYAWDMGSCDPCSAEPLNPEELKQAGVFWLNADSNSGIMPSSNVFITRLHLRYSRDKFPEDLRFQETPNQQLFQGRYVISRPYRGNDQCSAMETYKKQVKERQEKEAQTLAQLTGWDINKIREKIDFLEYKPTPWWRNLWQSLANKLRLYG